MSRVEEGEMLRINETDMAISAHRCFGMEASIITDITRSSRDLLNLYDKEFCSGVSAGALSKDMPFSEGYELNSFDIYSPPRSDLRILICLPWYLSDSLRYFTKHEKTWDFDLMGKMVLYRVASSIKDTTYFDPPEDTTGSGPTTSLCIRKRGVSDIGKLEEKGRQ